MSQLNETNNKIVYYFLTGNLIDTQANRLKVTKKAIKNIIKPYLLSINDDKIKKKFVKSVNTSKWRLTAKLTDELVPVSKTRFEKPKDLMTILNYGDEVFSDIDSIITVCRYFTDSYDYDGLATIAELTHVLYKGLRDLEDYLNVDDF